ncbi:hypothetical protein FDG50_12235 [Clostridium botulinum]|uniref:hypothetical protein n=1 Tax=Clostridium botulinum TaxID=1491 RepID=UPI0013F048CE|nr:hypothetical protein [Clostridium botulinum]MBY6835880.1 hypothetical protein [Clostridium botulinum]MBY6917665.1 hypothetical protein [Clostridium botulinum]NFG64350.1 hypothetical protein [Clostridium botulinum]NFL34157.1 hypothetical protein [Clostridium botulinum]NFM03477.1 hypothetical protein [Clostridium botulinum]
MKTIDKGDSAEKLMEKKKSYFRLKENSMNAFLKFGEEARKFLHKDKEFELVRYVEIQNKLKFTFKFGNRIYFEKFEIKYDNVKLVIESYPVYKDLKQYKFIVKLLRKKGKTQNQIANRLAISQASISRMLN